MSLLTPNLRDVGREVNRIEGTDLLREDCVFRSGELGLVRSLDQIGAPRTIVNLESTEDPVWSEGEIQFHLPIPDSTEVYETASPQTLRWLDSVISLLANENVAIPILIHCTAGKDRTGVAVAAMLAGIGIEKQTIIAEYQQSTGPLYPEKIAALIDLISMGEFLSFGIRDRLRAIYAKPEQDVDLNT